MRELTNILNQINNVNMFHNTKYISVSDAAEYYGMKRESLRTVIKRNKALLKNVKVYNSRSLREMVGNDVFIPSRGLMLMDLETLVMIGMMLRDSEIAKILRETMIKEFPEIYSRLSPENIIRIKRYEEEIGNYLEFSFGKENIKRQVRCGKYYLDFVLFDMYNIEVDENGHSGYDYEKEAERTKYILDNTEYITIRYNPHYDTPYKLIAKIFEAKELFEEDENLSFDMDWCLKPYFDIA